MQISPSQSQRQLISGKVGWGWRQATYPISVNFIFTGVFMLVVSFSRLGDESNLQILMALLAVLGLIVGICTAKSVVQVCRQNSSYAFSRPQLFAIAIYWLSLLAALGANSEKIAKVIISLWWILPAAIFTGIAIAITWHSSQPKTTSKLQLVDLVSPDILSVITYSDRTVCVSPSSLGQQPRQFNSLILMALGLFIWTMFDFAPSIRAIVSIIFTASGLTGFFTWQAQLCVPIKTMFLEFSGLWGIGASYAISLQPFSSLALIKLQEASGELSWMQLSGSNCEVTLPLAMTIYPTSASPVHQNTKDQSNQPQDQLSQAIREEFNLARQESERDSLGLSNVLLPQGAGILASGVFIALGILFLFVFPLPFSISGASAIAWLGVCLVSPAIARFCLQMVAPNSLQSDRPYYDKSHLQPWEIGMAMLLISLFISAEIPDRNTLQLLFSRALPMLSLIGGWLNISIGVCLLAFVRRTPLWHKSY
ncbi:MAG: hypothetical protein DCE90_16690 [Pseudanabaena sp.]|nr:MAG: hypothetical protein DCE90_16690 [Pseudanabaena sp.]